MLVFSFKKMVLVLACSDYESTNALNKFFTSVLTKEPITNIPTLPDKSSGGYKLL